MLRFGMFCRKLFFFFFFFPLVCERPYLIYIGPLNKRVLTLLHVTVGKKKKKKK